jgi:hypothetical protein
MLIRVAALVAVTLLLTALLVYISLMANAATY